ncbi:hypothetical protein H8356DRAFT_1419716 [Neocallimastix lanati (nom. inval.)]|uniref:Uncharacterized protein n=1 Tax=Neocallimastix californiae TaxID=1754190 RepID=A0A1Y2FTJ4_9FUNG|nr:hypothetical protein H8356DRAFT_1419716 [Neocallimastix sp. JGI-2020a]ORY87322.1 hypothetical protein LY90DRAFT_663033 [Neocallimastix californiae]|eukprot:ORY87322.1 hypothetical protein LY90DRAFT_663033 [Neocallimastix californiae]
MIRCCPRLTNYWCCCCLPLKPAVKLCTWMMIIFLIISLIFNIIFFGISFGSILSYIVYIIVIISLITLLIGISKVNLPFMNQFKIVFLLFLVFQTVMMIWDLKKKFEDRIVYSNVNGKQYKHTIPSEYGTFKKILLIILAIVDFLIMLYYYIATCSYIEEVEENVEDIEKSRRLERN